MPSTDDKENFTAYINDNNCYNLKSGKEDSSKVVDPEGTVYFEANSATGSKYYQLIGTQQDYIAARCQSWRPTYSVLDITDTTLTVKTYDAASNEELVADGGVKTAYTIVKQADKTALDTEIAKAEAAYDTAKKAGNYTEASLKTLEDTITAAKAVTENAESTTTDIASAVTSLQDAVKGLATVENNDNKGNTENNNNAAGNGTEDTAGTGNGIGTEDNGEAGQDASGSGNSSANASGSSSTVKTGDTAKAAVWYTAAGLSMAGAAGIILVERKKKKLNQ